MMVPGMVFKIIRDSGLTLLGLSLPTSTSYLLFRRVGFGDGRSFRINSSQGVSGKLRQNGGTSGEPRGAIILSDM